MKKLFKWLGIVLGGLILLLAVAAGALLLIANDMLSRTYTVTLPPLSVPSDAATLERGRHIVTTVCVICHGDDLGGKVVVNSPIFAVISGLNLTRGQGGVAAEEYKTDADWVRAIRYGLDPEGESLIMMPSYQFYYLSDADLAAVIAYIKSVPPVNNDVADPQFSVFAKLLLPLGGLGKLYVVSAIPANTPPPPAPAPGVSAAYGHYLARIHICAQCHKSDLGGGANDDPAAPYESNLTPGGDLGGWTQADFVAALRMGVRPNGKAIDPAMPWKVFGGMTDDELDALWLYLKSLPPVARKGP